MPGPRLRRHRVHPPGVLLFEYATVKQLHIGLVGASGLLFVVRGAGALRQAPWPMAAWARHGSVVIDSLLLAAGLTLWSWRGFHPGADAWLHTKLALLLAYIVAGSFALKRARSPAGRLGAFLLALALFATMIGVALAHHPLGWLQAVPAFRP